MLETSSLARKRTAGNSNDKNAKLGQNGSWEGHVTKFGILIPPNISRTVEAGNFKFGMETYSGEFKRKTFKIG